MRIVNPSYGVSAENGEELAGNPVDWMKDPIALFSNSKPNARELMDGLKAKLAAGGSRDLMSEVADIDGIKVLAVSTETEIKRLPSSET